MAFKSDIASKNNIPLFSIAITIIGIIIEKRYTIIFNNIGNCSFVIISIKFIAIPNASTSNDIT